MTDTQEFLAYALGVSILGGSIHTVKENADFSLDATREIGLEVSCDKHHAFQSQDRNNKYSILYIEFCIKNKI